MESDEEEAKRFDLLILSLQLAVLRHEPAFRRLRDMVINIARLLEAQGNIPMIAAQRELIEEIQSDQWWQDVTSSMLESVRRRLRSLVSLIEKQRRRLIYSDFEDELGSETMIDLLGIAPRDSFEQFRVKARAVLREHEDHVSIHRLRMNKPLTASDPSELDRMLGNVGDVDTVEKAREGSQGLGLFVRGLVGMDRGAAKEAFADFLVGKALSPNQIEFIDMVINYLTDHGVMGAALLYDSPFTDVAPRGPDG